MRRADNLTTLPQPPGALTALLACNRIALLCPLPYAVLSGYLNAVIALLGTAVFGVVLLYKCIYVQVPLCCCSEKFYYIKISDMSVNIMTTIHMTYIFTENQ